MGKVREGITDALKKKKHKKRKHGELAISVGEDGGDVELGLSGLSEVVPDEVANMSEDNMPRKKKKKDKSRSKPEDGNNCEEMEKFRKIDSVEDARISNTVEAAGGLNGVESDEKSSNAELTVVNEEVQPKKGKKEKKKSKLESESIGGEGTCLSDVASAEKKIGDKGTDKVHLKNKKQKEKVFGTNEKEEPTKDNTQNEKKDILEETDKFEHVEGQSKKKKREKKKQKDSGDGSSHKDDSSKRSLNSENKDIHEAVGCSTLGEDQNDSGTAEVESDKKSERTKKKKHKECVNDTHIASGNDGKGSQDGAKKRKKKLPAISTEENVDAADSVNSGRNEPSENSEKSNPSKKSRKVKFSDTVEIFSLPENSGEGDKNLVDEGQSNNAGGNVADGKKKKQKKRIVQDGLVYGKRFSKEEDEILRNAVLKYIEDHELGEEGVEMVMKCRQHWDKVKDCWTEIAEALPWRHREAIYSRAHILFERSETHKWSREELEEVRKYHQKHGPKWRQLADAIGRNRIHVKDAFRQIKLPNRKSGQWSQDEYQNLFNLVNKDLRIRASLDRKSKHGMLRDNIGWEAISHQLTTRTDPMCCLKWYSQLSSAMVADGQWADTDDYRLLMSLVDLDATCEEDVEWDHVLEHRDGEVCRKRWNEMLMHIGEHGNKLFSEQVEILSQRYCPDVLEARETYESKPFVD